MKDKSLNQSDLAYMSNIAQGTISEYLNPEKGRTPGAVSYTHLIAVISPQGFQVAGLDMVREAVDIGRPALGGLLQDAFPLVIFFDVLGQDGRAHQELSLIHIFSP